MDAVPAGAGTGILPSDGAAGAMGRFVSLEVRFAASARTLGSYRGGTGIAAFTCARGGESATAGAVAAAH